jgi:hypothetical protein
MEYREPIPISRTEAEEAFASGDSFRICDALVRITFHDLDWRWVQQWCIDFSKHPDLYIRGLAATCFGHLARIHGCLDLDIVLPILKDLLNDPDVGGEAKNAISDIRMFMKSDLEI